MNCREPREQQQGTFREHVLREKVKGDGEEKTGGTGQTEITDTFTEQNFIMRLFNVHYW